MRSRAWSGGSLVIAMALGVAGSAEGQTLSIGKSPTDGPALLSIAAGSNTVVTLQASGDLRGWTELLRGEGALVEAPDLRPVRPGASFYRAMLRPRTGADDGKNLIGFPGERLLSPESDPWRHQSRWVKFAILLSEPHRVWFQDSSKYDFHYDFARLRLSAFAGMTRAGFDSVTLRTNGQMAVLGAVVFPPTANISELGIQLVGLDAYPREQVAEWFETVRSVIQRPPGVQVLYLPTFEQVNVARQNRDWFAGRGVSVADSSRWVVGDECYAAGWALGRLVFVAGAEIEAAYRDGRLRHDDVLVTDAVPAEVPPLAGIISLSPATPNSHVALLSQSFGIPFVYLADAAMTAEVRGWTNQDVMIRAIAGYDACTVTVSALKGPLDSKVRDSIVALKTPPRLQLPAKMVSGRISLPADTLKPSDIGRVGGKAANFGVLRRAIPQNSPTPALAFTFDLWEGYLNQGVPGGQTLREAIAQRLAGLAWPPDVPAVQSALSAVRDLITDEADFSPTQQQEILEILQAAGFDRMANIRFRSSTNVEDSDQFSGAGLYDSYSGCLEDDLDDDSRGPSACDPTEERERGVFRALRKVFASFYNDNAFLERLRHGVDESTVGMGVLVHSSTPDPTELANGVATLDVNKTGTRYVSGEIVTQWGAVSVSNPDSTAVPETVSVLYLSAAPSLMVETYSSLVPLGSTVMTWDRDYQKLAVLLNQAAVGYEREFPAKKEMVLDFEFKKTAPDGQLSVKQIREVPQPPARTFTPWLLNTSNRLAIIQGEAGDLISKHRLKSRWTLSVRNVQMTDANLATSVLQGLEATWMEDTNLVTIDGPPSSLPSYTYQRLSDRLVDRWQSGIGAARRDCELELQRMTQTDSTEGPLIILGDHSLEWRVNYATARPTLEYSPEAGGWVGTTTRQESVQLGKMLPVTAESLRQERILKMSGVEVKTAFWWPPPPTGPSAGYTAPVQEWIETTITGLTTRPIRLRNDWAQTYQPGHHNFYEMFAFEPRLDPEVPMDLIAELERANIKAIILGGPNGDIGDSIGYVWGLDDRFRKL